MKYMLRQRSWKNRHDRHVVRARNSGSEASHALLSRMHQVHRLTLSLGSGCIAQCPRSLLHYTHWHTATESYRPRTRSRERQPGHPPFPSLETRRENGLWVAVAKGTSALPGCLPLLPSPLGLLVARPSTPETAVAGKGRERVGAAPDWSEELGDSVSSRVSSLVPRSSTTARVFAHVAPFFILKNKTTLVERRQGLWYDGLGWDIFGWSWSLILSGAGILPHDWSDRNCWWCILN
jgi:hypothetical protein